MYSLSNLLNEAFPPSFFIAKVGSPVALGSLASVDMMAAEGTFPMLGDLLPAFYLAILLCMIRWMLHRCLFRVSLVVYMTTLDILCKKEDVFLLSPAMVWYSVV